MDAVFGLFGERDMGPISLRAIAGCTDGVGLRPTELLPAVGLANAEASLGLA